MKNKNELYLQAKFNTTVNIYITAIHSYYYHFV